MATGRAFISFNTPENIRWMKQWERIFGAKLSSMRDYLPAHYKRKKRKACKRKVSAL